MIIITILFGLIFASVLICLITGMTLHDIRAVKTDREFRAHPYARKWRTRPLVSIIISGTPTADCLASIRRSNYRKIQIVTNGQMIDGNLILTLSPNTVLEQTTITQAVRALAANPRQPRIELFPVLNSPQTLRHLFRIYRHITAAPFATARAGLGVTLPQSAWPTLVHREQSSLNIQTRLYMIGRLVVQLMNIATLLYAGYLATYLYQPDFLLLYLATFGVWLIWSIGSYRYFTFGQKLAYLSLAPVSCVSFLYHCITAPLRIMQYGALLPRKHRSGIMAIIDI